jgi:hypothetical protein
LLLLLLLLLPQELSKAAAQNSELGQKVASLQAEVLKELKAKQALEETVKGLKANVTSPPAATPAAAAAAGAGSSGRAAAGRATGGRFAKRRRGEALPEDDEFHGEGAIHGSLETQ